MRSRRLPGSSAGPIHMSDAPTTTTLALAVWPAPTKQPHRYLAAARGQHAIQPELAARAILAYTDPGDLVIDPRCGIGTVLVEAIHNGRRAIGIEADRAAAALATANISHARAQGAPGRAAVLEGSPDRVGRLLAKATRLLGRSQNPRLRRHPAGSVQLLLTAAPAVPDERLLADWRAVIAPGGFLLLVHDQQAGAPGLGTIVAACERTGLEFWQHVVAVRRSPSESSALLHTDVLAFRKSADKCGVRSERRVAA
jgi:SAM-dependent methyltransferase